MAERLLWMITIAPAAFATAGFMADDSSGPRRGRLGQSALLAGFAALAVAIAGAGAVVWRGPMHTGTLGVAGIGFAIYLDRLSAVLLVLVSFIGAVVVRYAARYVEGDLHHGRFMRWLHMTLAAVLVLIIAGNLFQFLVAWIATSLGLNRLLLFHPERPSAVLAAHKKFVASRIGDACLAGALLLLYRGVGSLDYTAIFARAAAWRAAATQFEDLHAIAMLLVVTALLKSAQFPLHGWLTEVMETPTPVSALLHAGIINAGGFLVLRFSPVIALSAPSLDTLALLGGLTALFGSAVMLTQTSVKVSLAYSTIAQMGFMMLECGLGAFPAALLHLVAHSLYKAHAFLSSGGVIGLARASWTPGPGSRPHPARTAIAIAVVVGLAAAIGALFGEGVTQQPGVFALGAIVLMGLVHLVSEAIDERPDLFVLGRTLGLAGLVAASYFALQWVVERLFADSLAPARALRGPVDVAIVAGVVGCFAVVTVLQSVAPRQADKPRWQALYVHIANGLYVNAFANRLVLRLWPSAPLGAKVYPRASMVAMENVHE